ncbi:hypothetical protein V6N13_071213 [Hibiscus sabdariffa]
MDLRGWLGLRLSFIFFREKRVSEHERAIITGVFILIKIGGAEINTGAALQGCEKCSGHAGADPTSHAINLVARDEAAAVVHRLV